MHDLVIRNGTIVDGSGGETYTADVSIDGCCISGVGLVPGSGRAEIDASGLVVTPGFVDLHTHYDCQVTWDTRLVPSSHHGVTTVVLGNCSVGIAPCRAEDRELLIRILEGVEDIPGVVAAEGIPWQWETFPEYLNFLQTRCTDVDFVTQIAHSAVRVYAMGSARGGARERATSVDQARMTELVAEAIRAGAIGVSSSRTWTHRTADGQLAPSETSSEAELMALARGIRTAGTGVFEIVMDFTDLENEDSADFDLMRRIVRASGNRPLSYSLFQLDSQPEVWKSLLRLTAEANASGLPITAQVMPRANGIMWGLTASYNPFSYHPSYHAIAGLPLPARVAAMRAPQFKARVLAEKACGNQPQLMNFAAALLPKGFLLGNPPDYEQTQDQTLGARARRAGVSMESLVYDLLLEEEGRSFLYTPITNYHGGSYDDVLSMLSDENTLPSLGDGGAHYGMICDASYSTYLLTHWVKGRTRGGRISLPLAIQRLTSRPARAVGLLDRGMIASGYKADLNVLDFDALQLLAPETINDLPSGAPRMIQRAKGYIATIVSGTVTYANGEPTEALPGRLVRGPRNAPSAARVA
jgi:N-acyl-D-aspartate/D-glutamate deacylase